MSPPSDDPSAAPPRRAGVDRKLLEILVCPATHGPLEYDAAAGEFAYREGINQRESRLLGNQDAGDLGELRLDQLTPAHTGKRRIDAGAKQ